MKEGGDKWGMGLDGMREQGESGNWEGLFGVGEGTHHQTIKILTGQEYTMSP